VVLRLGDQRGDLRVCQVVVIARCAAGELDPACWVRRYPAFLHGRIEDGNEHTVNVETRT